MLLQQQLRSMPAADDAAAAVATADPTATALESECQQHAMHCTWLTCSAVKSCALVTGCHLFARHMASHDGLVVSNMQMLRLRLL